MNSTSSFSMDLTKLSPEQLYAFQRFKEGKNIFVTGPGGTGKTMLIHYLIEHAKRINKHCQVCALTGCAAILLNCGATTINSWSGIRLAKGEKTDIIKSVLSNKRVSKSWRKVSILIVDEVSMMSKKVFEVIEEIARTTRKTPLPFGGIQVVFTGDFFQLPPVFTMYDTDESFCFESPIWNKVFPLENHIELKTMFRQTDPLYIQILLEIRKGTISNENKKILQEYVKREYDIGIIPTKLFPVRNKVDFVNNAMFEKLEETPHTFEYEIQKDLTSFLNGKMFSDEVAEKCRQMTTMEKEREIEFFANTIQCPKSIVLKKGAIVMCTYNIDIDNGISNGSQGIVIDIIERNGKKSPVVKFHNGRVLVIEPKYWQSEDYPCIAIGQVPLCLAWALTIHKVQGTTLAMAEIDIGNSVFEYGQIYVALSRIQSLSGLYLLSFNPFKIKANPRVIEFYHKIPPLEIPSSDSSTLSGSLIEEDLIGEQGEQEKEEKTTKQITAPPMPTINNPIFQKYKIKKLNR